MARSVIILVGVPGSGKSHWASGLQRFHNESRGAPYREVDICSADDFFLKSGKYKYDPTAISPAHNACLRRFVANFDHYSQITDTVVDNTNLSVLDWTPYIRVGQAFGASVEIRVFDGGFQNIHGVPFDKMASMRVKFRDLLNSEVISRGDKQFSRTFPNVPIIFHIP